MSDVTLLASVVQANPVDATARLIYADAIQESGDEATAKTERGLATLIAGGAEKAREVLNGLRADGRTSAKRGSHIRGELCRRTGATNRRGRPLTCVRFDVVEGDAAPTYEGESYHFETPGGTLVRHPNAYRRAWGKPVYCPAHHVVTVGATWLILHADELAG